jgi:bifunctional non-homologous end joining protein LigD
MKRPPGPVPGLLSGPRLAYQHPLPYEPACCVSSPSRRGFIPPCLPTKASTPPSGGLWLHEIKHDGFRIIARKDEARVRLYSRPGNDLTDRFPLIVETLANLRTRSCIIDGEAVACDERGTALGAHPIGSRKRIQMRQQ